MLKLAYAVFFIASLLSPMRPALAEAPARGGRQDVTIFAAASLKDALDETIAAYEARTGAKVVTSYGASLTLARQIEAGAPADLFFSADAGSMDYLAERRLINANTRIDLLSNELVVIAPQSFALRELMLTREAFLEAVGAGRLAMGDPAFVPAGKYAQAALETFNLWSALEKRLAFTDNVRAALLLVAREEAPLGLVYLTDAMSEPKVKIVARFPASSRPAIVYPIALIARETRAAPEELLVFLQSPEASSIFRRRGFLPLAPRAAR